MPTVGPKRNHVWHVFVVQTMDRDRLQGFLRDHSIETLIHYPIPPHLQKAYEELGYMEGSFPISESIHKSVLSLPIGPHLSEEHVMEVCDVVKKFYGA